MKFNKSKKEKYKRHIVLEDIGIEGQEKLLKSGVLIVGVGGLGSTAALNLSAMGIGRIGLMDTDTVDISNLHRQILYDIKDVGKSKLLSAKKKIQNKNEDVKIDIHKKRITEDNGLDIVKDYDFIIDGTDNNYSKFLINDICVTANKPFCYGGASKFTGQVMTVIPHDSACLRCLFKGSGWENDEQDLSRLGVFGILPNIIGSIQATEAVKYLLGLKGLIKNELLTYNVLNTTFRKTKISRAYDCKGCSKTSDVSKRFDKS